jgi:hypothetical protein
MRALADFAMRGRNHAIGIAVISASLPLLNWLCSAIVGLVILRKGPLEGLLVLMWAMIPLGLAVYYIGDPSSVIALVGTAMLAYALRVTVSWELTFALAVVISVIGSLIFELTATEVLAAIVELYRGYTAQIAAELQTTGELSYEAAQYTIMGFFAMGQAYAMLLFLILARWWQSQLYNPGGFQKEFHQLRLSPLMSGILIALLLVCFSFNELLGRWIPVLTVPLVMMALSLVHWMMSYQKLTGFWVFGFYILLLMLFQVIYPLLATVALMDSWFNLRARIQSKEV